MSFFFLYIKFIKIIQFIGDGMFEYTLNNLKIYGFIKILHLDETYLSFKYKRKELIVVGKGLKIMNLSDKTLEIKGIIERIDIKYLGEEQ